MMRISINIMGKAIYIIILDWTIREDIEPVDTSFAS